MYKKLKIILTHLVHSLFIRNGVSIDYSKHTVLNSYNDHSPIKYVNKYFSKIHHAINHVPVGWEKPFIIEFEHFLYTCHYQEYKDYKKLIEGIDTSKKLLESDLCKGIIIWSHGSLREMEKYIDTSSIKEKIYLIRPTIKEINFSHVVDNKLFRILNIGNNFWSKGTFMVIEAFKIFHTKYKDSTLNLVCHDIPEDFTIPNGIIVNNTSKLNNKDKLELFANSDIFLHPALQDAYGVYIEALAYKLPTVTSSIYDKDEVILNNICGHLVDSPFTLFDSQIGIEFDNYEEFVVLIKKKYVAGEFDAMIKELVVKIEHLYLNRNLLDQMRLNCHNHFNDNFSLDKRNEKLNKIYNKILKEI